MDAILASVAAGTVKDWSFLKKEWEPLLAAKSTVATLKKHSASAKTCVSIATSGIKAISSGTSTLEHEELIFTCLSILDRLGKAKLLKAAPLEVEKMWFNFARKVCAAGNNARGIVYVKHLLQLLGSGRGNQENCDASLDFLPEDDDGESRVYLTSCALVCFCTAQSATAPIDLLSNSKLWNQTLAWLSRVADQVKKEQLLAELGRVEAAALRGAAKAPISTVAQFSFVRNRIWCLAFIVCVNAKSAIAPLRDCFASAAEASFGPENEAVLIMCAKKMEDFRKAFVLTLEGAEMRLEASKVLSMYAQKLIEAIDRGRPRHDKLEPFAAEAVGTAAVILAEQGHLSESEALLRLCADKMTSISLSPKYYNVGVALYAAGRIRDACKFVQLSCSLLQKECDAAQQIPASFAERHLVLAQCFEKDNCPEKAFEAAVWALRGGGGDQATAQLLRLWQQCKEMESSVFSLLSPLSSESRWQLILSCSRWRPLDSSSTMLSALLDMESAHVRSVVERARLANAAGRLDEARVLLASAAAVPETEGLAKFWLAVIETERLASPSSHKLLLEASNWFQAACSVHEAGKKEEEVLLLIGQGLMDVFELIDRPSDAIPVAKALAAAFPNDLHLAMNEVRLEKDAAVDWSTVDTSDLTDAIAAADAMCAVEPAPLLYLSPLIQHLVERSSGASLWQRCRIDYLAALCAFWSGKSEEALELSISAMRSSIAASKMASDELSPWQQLRFSLEASALCSSLHEARGLVLEAEFLCSKALDVCSAASRCTVFRSMLCSTACKRRDLKEGKAIMGKLRGDAKALHQQVADHKLALSYYKEAVGEFHLCKWEESRDQESATEAYQRFKQAVALCSGRRAQLLKIKQGVALSRIAGRSDDAIALWEQVAASGTNEGYDAQVVAAAQFQLGLQLVSSVPAKAAHLLELAMQSRRLDHLQQAKASSELAILAKTPLAQFAWLAQSIGITHGGPSIDSSKIECRIPSSWTVVSVSIVERDGREEGLLVSRVENGGESVTVRLLTSGRSKIKSIRSTFSTIVARSDETTRRQVASSQDKKLWWKDRAQLDQELKDTLSDMEESWFGTDKELLRPVAKPVKKTTTRKTTVKSKRVAEDNLDEQQQQQHLILVIGAGLEHIPWESMPVLRKCAVSRMPSLSFVLQPKAEASIVIDPRKTFYILNPSNDLQSTQSVFEGLFRENGWQGIAGVAPTSEQFLDALKSFDLFVYCGHNSGEQYLRRESIERKLDAVRPVSLLMGCSSAALKDLGKYEPCGIVQSYLQARCPAVAGNLFDVTDADIDRFLLAVLENWITKRSGSLIQCIAEARDTCKLAYLVGSSPVVYGLPTVDLK